MKNNNLNKKIKTIEKDIKTVNKEYEQRNRELEINKKVFINEVLNNGDKLFGETKLLKKKLTLWDKIKYLLGY